MMETAPLTSLCNKRGEFLLLVAPMWTQGKLPWSSSVTHKSRTWSTLFFFCSCLHLSLSRLLFSMLQTQFYLLEHLEAFRKCWLSSSFRPAFANRAAFNTRRLEWFALFALDLKDDGYLLDKMCMCLLKPTPGMILFFCHAGWSLATMFLETSNDGSLHTSLLPVPALKYLYSKRVFLVFKHPFV